MDRSSCQRCALHLRIVLLYSDPSAPVRYIESFKQRQSLYAVGQVQEVSASWQLRQCWEGRNRSRRSSNDVRFAHSWPLGSDVQRAQRLWVAPASCMHITARPLRQQCGEWQSTRLAVNISCPTLECRDLVDWRFGRRFETPTV